MGSVGKGLQLALWFSFRLIPPFLAPISPSTGTPCRTIRILLRWLTDVHLLARKTAKLMGGSSQIIINWCSSDHNSIFGSDDTHSRVQTHTLRDMERMSWTPGCTLEGNALRRQTAPSWWARKPFPWGTSYRRSWLGMWSLGTVKRAASEAAALGDVLEISLHRCNRRFIYFNSSHLINWSMPLEDQALLLQVRFQLTFFVWRCRALS